MSDVPKARGILEGARAEILAGKLNPAQAAEKITQALECMTRESYVRKTAPRSRGMTANKVVEIKGLLAQFPDEPIQALAVRAGVNAGRVSEVAHGKHDGLLKWYHVVNCYRSYCRAYRYQGLLIPLAGPIFVSSNERQIDGSLLPHDRHAERRISD